VIFFFISLSTYFCYLVLKYQKNLEVLQSNKFNMKNYLSCIKENSKKWFLTPELTGFILIVIALNADAKVMGICMVIFYTLMYLYELKGFKKHIKLNADIIRTILITLVIYILVFIMFILDFNKSQSEFLIYDNRYLYYIIMIIMSYFSFIVVLLSGFVNNVIIKITRKLFKTKKNKKQK